MYNPEHQEKHLAPMDVKIQKKAAVMTVVTAVAIVLGVFLLAEIIDKVISSLRSL